MIEQAISYEDALAASPQYEIVARVNGDTTTYTIQRASEDSEELLFTLDQALAVIEAKLEQAFVLMLEV